MPRLTGLRHPRQTARRQARTIYPRQRLAGFMLRLRQRRRHVVQDLHGRLAGRRKTAPAQIGSASAYHADRAREEARRMLQAARAGEDPPAERARNKGRPNSRIVDRFRTLRLAKRKPATRKDYEGRIRRILMPALKGGSSPTSPPPRSPTASRSTPRSPPMPTAPSPCCPR